MLVVVLKIVLTDLYESEINAFVSRKKLIGKSIHPIDAIQEAFSLRHEPKAHPSSTAVLLFRVKTATSNSV